MTSTEIFLTVGELLIRWNIDRRTLEKQIENGLAYVHFPEQVKRFPLSIVIAYEEKHFRGTS